MRFRRKSQQVAQYSDADIPLKILFDRVNDRTKGAVGRAFSSLFNPFWADWKAWRKRWDKRTSRSTWFDLAKIGPSAVIPGAISIARLVSVNIEPATGAISAAIGPLASFILLGYEKVTTQPLRDTERLLEKKAAVLQEGLALFDDPTGPSDAVIDNIIKKWYDILKEH